MTRAVAFLRLAFLLLAGCRGGSPGLLSNDRVASLREVDLVPDPPGTSGRDGGYSVRWGDESVWIFGDTFFADASADGYHWRASTWSATRDGDAHDGLGAWRHGLGADGKPLALIPHTDAEAAFNDAHNGERCAAGADCGARHTVWPGALVIAGGEALVFGLKMETRPEGAYAFHHTGTLIARWRSPAEAASRPEIRPGQPDPTELFGAEEPSWGAAALLEGELLHAYACDGGGLTAPCKIARVPVGSVHDRGAWRFWDGTGWVADWRAAVGIFDGAPMTSVHFNRHLGKFVAIYLVPLVTDMELRTADRPEGPWSPPTRFGRARPAQDGHWPYGLLAHPDLSPDAGRTEYLTYHQPGTFLNGVIRLLEITFD